MGRARAGLARRRRESGRRRLVSGSRSVSWGEGPRAGGRARGGAGGRAREGLRLGLGSPSHCGVTVQDKAWGHRPVRRARTGGLAHTPVPGQCGGLGRSSRQSITPGHPRPMDTLRYQCTGLQLFPRMRTAAAGCVISPDSGTVHAEQPWRMSCSHRGRARALRLSTAGVAPSDNCAVARPKPASGVGMHSTEEVGSALRRVATQRTELGHCLLQRYYICSPPRLLTLSLEDNKALCSARESGRVYILHEVRYRLLVRRICSGEVEPTRSLLP